MDTSIFTKAIDIILTDKVLILHGTIFYFIMPSPNVYNDK